MSCCILLVTAFAARPQSSQDSSRLKSVLNALETHYGATRTLEADFLERYSESERQIRVESGKVYFSRPGRMRWEYESPESKLFVSDGKTLWFYVPSDRTATKQSVKQSEDWRTPLALLTGKVNLSRLCSRVEFADSSPGAAGDVMLRCWPHGEKAPKGEASATDPMTGTAGNFTQVLLEVDPSSGRLSDVRVLQPGSVEVEFRFGAWKENEPLAASLFDFSPPEGVAILPWDQLNQSPH
ncbi:MAG: LolA family protein [Candidatus Acidiferrales bacterium]